MPEEKQKFIELLAESGAVQFGDFTAKSGRKTPFFINTGKLMYGDQLDLLSRMYAQTYVENIGRESRLLFGPAYKGITLIAVTAAALYRQYGVRAPICFNRKEKKDHGEGGVFVGKIPEEGDRIVIVEDVITVGTAIRESLNHAMVCDGDCRLSPVGSCIYDVSNFIESVIVAHLGVAVKLDSSSVRISILLESLRYLLESIGHHQILMLICVIFDRASRTDHVA